MDERLFFCYLAGIPVLGVAAQWLAWRLRLPSILLLLAFGMLLGQVVDPDALLADVVGADGESVAPRLLFPVVSLAVAVILFEGGLTLRLSELKTAGRSVFRLVTVGAALSWGLATCAAWWLLELNGRMAALLGAVLVVTGPTVVGPLLRHIRPVRRVASIAKWEGIVIDPIGAILGVLVFEEILAHGLEASPSEMFRILALTLLVGGLIGTATAMILIQMVKRYWVPDYLHGVVFLAGALGAFAVSNLLKEESGLATVTLLGVILANQRSISVRHVIEFKEHLGVFLIACLFIVLGSRLDPRDLWNVGWQGLAFLAFMVVVVRPISVYVSTWRTQLDFRERTFLACLAPRGIVAAAVMSVFALKVATSTHLAEGHALVDQADRLVPITFVVIVGTVAIYGLTAAPLARWLGLADANPQGILFAGADAWIQELAGLLAAEGYPVLLIDTNYSHVAETRMAGLPADCSSILSEHVREELDLSGIGRLLALTPNDEVNTLATRELAHEFGRANVYQLAPWDESAGRRMSVGHHLRARVLFGEGVHYGYLLQRRRESARVKKTGLTEEFTWEDFRDLYGESALLLFVIENGQKLRVCVEGEATDPQPGSTIIALVNEPAETADSAAESS